MFNERMAALVGPTWCAAFLFGAGHGLTQPIPAKARTTRLWMNYKFNAIGKTGFRFANNSAAAVLLWIFTGKLIDFAFKEEFEVIQFADRIKVAAAGGIAGAIYKCTRGVRPMGFSFVLGAVLCTGYTEFYKYQKQRV